MKTIEWNSLAKGFFDYDGSLRDIYALATTVADWQLIFDFIRNHATAVEYTLDGEGTALPLAVTEVFAVRHTASAALLFRFGPVHYAVHFFCEEQFECDFWPTDVRGQPEFDALLSFIQQLGDLLQQRVILTDENSQEKPFLHYDPQVRRFALASSLAGNDSV